MKKNTFPKKLQLAKVQIAALNVTPKQGFICLTSFDQTTCPGCRRTVDNCTL
ncbi:class I lanthipeptide [Chitinophaga varians]|uniref:class I lanthipeptide n=1 Tax=Chitinophaga varians TaxID=2202339 RepID=UPI00165F6271|nr:class I lanthipeptide [Chitinophaga varians]MBC9913500.1 class I lanthipeptide [Chitinophaga varians]